MALLRIERALGPIDGVNRTFFTLSPYLPGSVRYWYNGVLQPPEDITEVNPATGEILAHGVPVPLPDDGVSEDGVILSWIDAASVQAELTGLVEVIRVRVYPEEELRVRVVLEEVLRGRLEDEPSIDGRLIAEEPLRGRLQEETIFRGSLTVCDEA